MNDIPPGDDVGPTPPPLVEAPPIDRFCDLVMTGGVASGVVYPWAIVELARAYRFRRIGGTSVGAMAAALAAAAEYGRRVGFDQSFEPLRRIPSALGEALPDGRTRMLSLFQAAPRGRRLMTLWGRLATGRPKASESPGRALGTSRRRLAGLWRGTRELIRVYATPLALGALVGAIAGAIVVRHAGFIAILALLFLVALGALVALVFAVAGDVRHGLIENGLGLCKGGTTEKPGPEGARPALTEWLHEGIQLSAALRATDRPLTFRDLWCAPLTPGAPHLSRDERDTPGRRSIDLEMITTNVTHGRPYRLPLPDATSRLFYKPAELEGYFPAVVMRALVAASRCYTPRGVSDPATIENADEFRELPGADLPIVVAARLSLSFPLLFSAVPLWAIDFEAAHDQRSVLKRCQFTDGGVSSNFPIHLFDAAIPRWPTFGFWLDRKDKNRPPARPGRDEDIVLPEFVDDGGTDNWNRFDPEAYAEGSAARTVGTQGGLAQFAFLGRFLGGIASSAMDWNDRTSMRMPHVRTRVARLMLAPGEGGLHIGMPREQILDMAHRYGTNSGRLFVQRYADRGGHVTRAWREQRWVRLVVLIDGLREYLNGLSASDEWSAHTVPMATAIACARSKAPLESRSQGDPPLAEARAHSLQHLLKELEGLAAAFGGEAEQESICPLVPVPELRLRAPL